MGYAGHIRGIILYALVYSGKNRVKGEDRELVSEEIVPAAITFRLGAENNYSLESYLIPSDEGEKVPEKHL